MYNLNGDSMNKNKFNNLFKKKEIEVYKDYTDNNCLVTKGLIIINILVFFMVNVRMGTDEIINYGISKYTFSYYRVFTSIFTHLDETHLIFNMLALYFCGNRLESFIGSLRYFFIYIISGIGSALCIGYLSNNLCVGASGAIFGLFGCYLLLALKNKSVLFYTLKYDLAPTLIINLLITFLSPNISVVGHISGLIIGLVTYFIFCRNIRIRW